jgi:adenylate cyclase
VLPFENMSGDPEQEYFADGMVEEIITALSRFNSLFVIARNSSFTFKGRSVNIKEVGRRLGVRYVLEGSVRKASGKVRITGQLIDALTDAHIWADRFERDLTDIFALRDEVTVAVVSAIQPKLLQTEIARATRRRPENLTAYDYYLRARQQFFLAKDWPRRSGWLFAPWNWTLSSPLLRLWQVAVTCTTSFGGMLTIPNSNARKRFGFLAWP